MYLSLMYSLGYMNEYVSNGRARINDGIISADIYDSVELGYARTNYGGPSYNNGSGVVLTFNRPVRIGLFAINAVTYEFDYVFEALVGSTWVNVGTIANHGARNELAYYEVNQDKAVISNQWRWRIANWNSTENFYAFELEAYEHN